LRRILNRDAGEELTGPSFREFAKYFLAEGTGLAWSSGLRANRYIDFINTSGLWDDRARARPAGRFNDLSDSTCVDHRTPLSAGVSLDAGGCEVVVR
jgi:hypothetical protein